MSLKHSVYQVISTHDSRENRNMELGKNTRQYLVGFIGN
jgi:hypothetical protein